MICRFQLLFLVVALIAGCSQATRRPDTPASPTKQNEALSPSIKQNRKRIFLKIDGEQRSAQRLRKFLEIAADDNDLDIANDSGGADAAIELNVIEKPLTQLHAHTVSAVVVRNGKSIPVAYCESVAEDNGHSRWYSADGWKTNDFQGADKIFIQDNQQRSRDFERDLQEEIKLVHVQFVEHETQADAILKDFKSIDESLPVTGVAQNITGEIHLRGRASHNFNHTLMVYRPTSRRISDASERCRTTLESYIHPADDPDWEFARNKIGEIIKILSN